MGIKLLLSHLQGVLVAIVTMCSQHKSPQHGVQWLLIRFWLPAKAVHHVLEKAYSKFFELGMEFGVGQKAIQICNVSSEVLPHSVVGLTPVASKETKHFVCAHYTSLGL